MSMYLRDTAYNSMYKKVDNRVKNIVVRYPCDYSSRFITWNNKKRFWLSIIDKIYISNGTIKEITFL